MQVTAIERSSDGRTAKVTLAVGDATFEATYLWHEDRVAISPRSPLGFCREELGVHAIVERLRSGAPATLPAPVVVPDDLSPRDRRRWSFFDTAAGKALIAA